MEKVTVLMSTYNGENYLIEQINSVLNQKDVEIQLIVRDDGSGDDTISILEEYEKLGKLTLIKGNNHGYIKSFMELIKNCGNSEYYVFALKRAVPVIELVLPVLFGCQMNTR